MENKKISFTVDGDNGSTISVEITGDFIPHELVCADSSSFSFLGDCFPGDNVQNLISIGPTDI